MPTIVNGLHCYNAFLVILPSSNWATLTFCIVRIHFLFLRSCSLYCFANTLLKAYCRQISVMGRKNPVVVAHLLTFALRPLEDIRYILRSLAASCASPHERPTSSSSTSIVLRQVIRIDEWIVARRNDIQNPLWVRR